MHRADCEPAGFRWVIGDDRGNSVFAWLRLAPEAEPVLVVANMTPVPRGHYRIGVPREGAWRELLNSDAAIYGGSNLGNGGGRRTAPLPSHGYPDSLELDLPPLSLLVLRHQASA